MKYLLIILLLVARPVRGESIGVCYYAIQNKTFPCEKALHVFDGVNHPSLSILWGTFGSDTKCIASFLSRFHDTPHTLYIHPINNTCRRSGRRCTTADLAELNPALTRQRVKNISAFVRLYGNENTKAIITTGLEDTYSDATYRRLFLTIRRAWPYEMASNPVYYSHRIGKVELHTPDRRANIYSNDGEVLSPEAFALKARSYPLSFYWWPNQGATSAFQYPQLRKISIDARDVRAVNQMMRRNDVVK